MKIKTLVSRMEKFNFLRIAFRSVQNELHFRDFSFFNFCWVEKGSKNFQMEFCV